MKTANEITQRVRDLEAKKRTLYNDKRKSESLSVKMLCIDNNIEKVSSEIIALKWVLK